MPKMKTSTNQRVFRMFWVASICYSLSLISKLYNKINKMSIFVIKKKKAAGARHPPPQTLIVGSWVTTTCVAVLGKRVWQKVDLCRILTKLETFVLRCAHGTKFQNLLICRRLVEPDHNRKSDREDNDISHF
jgi:hypothetical protein